jgi:hypothetical protein
MNVQQLQAQLAHAEKDATAAESTAAEFNDQAAAARAKADAIANDLAEAQATAAARETKP